MPDVIKTDPPGFDARASLGSWANGTQEWVRSVVRRVLEASGPLGQSDIEAVYQLFRQENGFDARVLPDEPPISTGAGTGDDEQPLRVTSLSEVSGVNALSPGAVIEPHDGLTVLYGENGTGKTGYSRVFKTLAASRTADPILGNVDAPAPGAHPSAKLAYTLGGDARTYEWSGASGVAPFSRMSIFDSRSVEIHVDSDLDYVYVPTVLTLFQHAVSAVQAVEARIVQDVGALTGKSLDVRDRIPRGTSMFPLIETVGAATDLVALKALADMSADVDERVEGARMAVAALEADTHGEALRVKQRLVRVLTQTAEMASVVAGLDCTAYNDVCATIVALESDYERVRSELFAAAALPADPDVTWAEFVESGERYRQHLVTLEVHDSERCLYCRQPLDATARDLVRRYGDYLTDKIGADIAEARKQRVALAASVVEMSAAAEVSAWLGEFAEDLQRPACYAAVERISSSASAAKAALSSGGAVVTTPFAHAADAKPEVDDALAAATDELATLAHEVDHRSETLTLKRRERDELVGAAELGKAWATIETYVQNALLASRLSERAQQLPALRRAITELSKAASKELVDRNFGALFEEERRELNAPELKVEFIGREARTKRRKMLKKHKPSKILSEGEQKVLALADFLAEARLTGISAPVIFDDPVSSLDHLRMREVAHRITRLAETAQVLVFTHDIAFATTLLMDMEKSKRCVYFHISDDGGKGRVARASGPRWDSVSNLTGRVKETIGAAKLVEGDERAALVRTGYGWLRSWCEAFTEFELLHEVTRRYQPMMRMTNLRQIKGNALVTAAEPVSRIYEEACRYIDSHAQPLATQYVAPTLARLEAHWEELQVARAAYRAADA